MIPVVAAVVILAAFTFTLFIRQKDIREPLPISPVQHLEDRKRAVYDNLRDLQFEFRLGKLSDEDYQQTKLALHKELAGVLADIEETLKNLGLSSTQRVSPTADPGRLVRSKSSAAVCPHCGARFPQPLKFCGECGKSMHEEVRS
jgi:hypothetical protein